MTTTQTRRRAYTSTTVMAFTLMLSALLVLVASTRFAAQSGSTESVRALVTQNSMNVFRRFAPENREKMLEFYGKVLALRSLSPVQLGGGNQMILFGVGTGQVKLATGLTGRRQYNPGPVKDATGLRVITLFFPDEAALVARFKEFGYAAPVFRAGNNGSRVAMVPDPGSFVVELVVVPNAPAGHARQDGGRDHRIGSGQEPRVLS